MATFTAVLCFRAVAHCEQLGRDEARDHLEANGRELVCREPKHHDDWNDAWRQSSRNCLR
ncbi:toprim domain-containing protein [Sphingomonas sp. PAMC26645]|uniref:toprim domain-containing protein n=1 Tax=Sphingomonas sp. PAMC26645 TaxID=2565555 RepID=UPI0032B5EA33